MGASRRGDAAVYMYGTPGPPNGPPCVWVPARLGRSDNNVFHNPALNFARAALFPGGLSQGSAFPSQIFWPLVVPR